MNLVTSKAKIDNNPLLIDEIINLQIPYTYLNVNDDPQGLISWVVYFSNLIETFNQSRTE